MTLENDNDFYKLTFSQREGKAPLPEPMQLKHIPRKFRQAIWSSIETEINRTSSDITLSVFSAFDPVQNIGSIIESYEYDILEHFHDEVKIYGPEEARTFFKESICEGNYHEVLTLLEYVLRHQDCSADLRNKLIDAFDETPVAYFVEEIEGLPTIVPRTSHESGEATRQAIEAIQQAGLGGSSTHLRQAAEHINAEQYHDSISDSISAVESVARQIAPESHTLGQALKVLENKGLFINQELKAGFKKLYDYTNSEEGIRHALVDKDSSDVGLYEAMFMFGACASFAAYLVNKHRQIGQ